MSNKCDWLIRQSRLDLKKLYKWKSSEQIRNIGFGSLCGNLRATADS